jgi:hypothetical protein
MMQPAESGVGVATREYPPVAVPHPAAPQVTTERRTPTTHDVQARAEAAEQPLTVEFLGKQFRLADNIGLMPLMQFAQASRAGLDTDDMEGMAALYSVIRDCIDQPQRVEPDEVLADDNSGRLVPNPRAGQPMVTDDGSPVLDETEWQRFVRHATLTKADGEAFMAFMQAAMQAISARPRTRRGNSSAGSPATSPRSRADFSSPDIPQRPGSEGLMSVHELVRSTD